MRVRAKQGSVVLDKRIQTWNFFYWQDGKRHSKTIGTRKDLPTKAAAWRAAKAFRDAVEQQTAVNVGGSIPTVSALVEQYRLKRCRSGKTRGGVINRGFASTSSPSGERV